MKIMYSTGYYHNRVVVTHALGHMMCVMCTEPLHCMEEPFAKVTSANIYIRGEVNPSFSKCCRRKENHAGQFF